MKIVTQYSILFFRTTYTLFPKQNCVKEDAQIDVRFNFSPLEKEHTASEINCFSFGIHPLTRFTVTSVFDHLTAHGMWASQKGCIITHKWSDHISIRNAVIFVDTNKNAKQSSYDERLSGTILIVITDGTLQHVSHEEYPNEDAANTFYFTARKSSTHWTGM